MTSPIKAKPAPGNARPDFRKVKPAVFVRKVIVMVVLIAVFGTGVLASNLPIKQAIACLMALAPLSCGIEVLVKGRRSLSSLVQGLAGCLGFGLVAMIFCVAAIVLPTLSCQFAIGAMLAHGTELAHQALHKKGTGRCSIDMPIGLVLCGASFVSFHRYLWSHHRHHRLNGKAEDRESFDYQYALLESPSRALRLLGLLLHLTLVGHYVTAAKLIALAVRGMLRHRLLAENKDMSPQVADKVQREYQYQALLILTAVSISLVLQTTVFLDLWLIPVLIGWGPCHSLIESTEHWHCDVPNPDVFCNTRSLRCSQFAQWFTNFNNCHTGHHQDMSVPADNLPAYESELVLLNRFAHMEESYPSFYACFFRHVWTG